MLSSLESVASARPSSVLLTTKSHRTERHLRSGEDLGQSDSGRDFPSFLDLGELQPELLQVRSVRGWFAEAVGHWMSIESGPQVRCVGIGVGEPAGPRR